MMMLHYIIALVVFSVCLARISAKSPELSGDWLLTDASGQNFVEHVSSGGSYIGLRLSLNGQALEKTLHKVKGAFSEGAMVKVVQGKEVVQTISGASIGVHTYADQAGTAVLTITDGHLDGLVVHDGFAWHLQANASSQLTVDRDGSVEGLCGGEDIKGEGDRRLAVERWTDCYTGDSVTRRFSIGAVIASGLFERRFSNNHAQATEWLNSIVAEATLIYRQQLNIVLTVGDLIIQQGSQGAPSWDDPSCRLGISQQLKRFQAWVQPSKQGLWHLFDDCYEPPGGYTGLATMLVSDVPGTLCREQNSWNNEFWNTAVSWYNSRSWATFAHETGHNFGGHHSFEEGTGATGGIMDYGDGKLNGEYQFNTKYRKEQICNSIEKVIGTCSAFSNFNDDTATTTTTTTSTPASTSRTGLLSGDVVFLKTHSGVGGHVRVEGRSVRARWKSRYNWNALVIEKASGGSIHSGDTVFLKTHRNTYIDIQGDAVQARWKDQGLWQSVVIEKKKGNGAILTEDKVCFKAHTGKHIDVQNGVLRARWEECGYLQTMVIERENVGAVVSGATVTLKARTGKFIDVQGEAVRARWNVRGLWQSLVIKKRGARRAIFSGKVLDVQGKSVQARWNAYGSRQRFIIEKAEGGASATASQAR